MPSVNDARATTINHPLESSQGADTTNTKGKRTMKSHPGTNGCRVMSRIHTDTAGRKWPEGTAYRPLSRGSATVDREDGPVDVTIQRIAIESSHYQTVLADGFGETVEFIED